MSQCWLAGHWLFALHATHVNTLQIPLAQSLLTPHASPFAVFATHSFATQFCDAKLHPSAGTAVHWTHVPPSQIPLVHQLSRSQPLPLPRSDLQVNEPPTTLSQYWLAAHWLSLLHATHVPTLQIPLWHCSGAVHPLPFERSGTHAPYTVSHHAELGHCDVDVHACRHTNAAQSPLVHWSSNPQLTPFPFFAWHVVDSQYCVAKLHPSAGTAVHATQVPPSQMPLEHQLSRSQPTPFPRSDLHVNEPPAVLSQYWLAAHCASPLHATHVPTLQIPELHCSGSVHPEPFVRASKQAPAIRSHHPVPAHCDDVVHGARHTPPAHVPEKHWSSNPHVAPSPPFALHVAPSQYWVAKLQPAFGIAVHWTHVSPSQIPLAHHDGRSQ